jgi:hypothetical protein
VFKPIRRPLTFLAKEDVASSSLVTRSTSPRADRRAIQTAENRPIARSSHLAVQTEA